MNTPKTIGIGSLPYADEAYAIDHVFSAYDVPFFPQLVQHPRYLAVQAPQMLQEVIPAPLLKHLFSGAWEHQSLSVQVWRGLHQEHIESLPAWTQFTARLKNVRPALCKFQLCGPDTAVKVIEHRTGKAMPEPLRQLLHSMIITQAQRMIAQISSYADTCIILWDEGEALINGGKAAMQRLDAACSAVERRHVVAGVHCCAPFDLSKFLEIAEGRYLAVDLSLPEFTSVLAQQVLKQIAHSGGLIAGVVDTRGPEVDHHQAKAAYALAHDLLQNSDSHLPYLISGACGSGLKNPTFETTMASCLSALVHLSHPSQ